MTTTTALIIAGAATALGIILILVVIAILAHKAPVECPLCGALVAPDSQVKHDRYYHGLNRIRREANR